MSLKSIKMRHCGEHVSNLRFFERATKLVTQLLVGHCSTRLFPLSLLPHQKNGPPNVCVWVCAVSICYGPIWFALIKSIGFWYLFNFVYLQKRTRGSTFDLGVYLLAICSKQHTHHTVRTSTCTMHMLWKQCMRPFIAHAVTLCVCATKANRISEYSQCIAWPNSHVWTWHMQRHSGHNLCRWLVAMTVAQHGKFDKYIRTTFWWALKSIENYKSVGMIWD